jgi:trehalose 6-phosphate phosphatase
MPDHTETGPVPLLWNAVDRLDALFRNRGPALFLDFDGTLAPIVDDPAAAAAPGTTLDLLARLASRMPVFVVSGREIADLRPRVPVPGIALAGSHGIEIETADGRRHDRGADFAGDAEAAAAALDAALAGLPGVRIERKRSSVAVHTRTASDAARTAVGERVAAVAAATPRLRLHRGKEVLELLPAVPWNKGRAVLWLVGTLGFAGAVPVAIGDDRTDEDAFRAVAEGGLGILVADVPRPTAARLRLADPADVARFLRWLDARTA